MPKPPALTQRKARFAAAFAQHHNASLACREAGYSAHGRSASVTGTRLLADVCVLGRIQALEAASAQELGVTRQKFLNELQVTQTPTSNALPAQTLVAP
jgi:phage terminase small subunit